MKKGLRVIIFACLVLLFSRELHSEYEPDSRHLLVLHSYSPSMKWVEEINSGITSVLNKEHNLNVIVTYEFLEAKQFHSEEYFQHTAEAIKFKYKNFHFDAIISCDDHALDFLIKFRDECLPQVPVFFCGVNDVYKKIDSADIKGIFEANPILDNFHLVHRLMPGIRNIYIVADPNTRTNKVYRRRIEEEVDSETSGINLELAGNLTFVELEEKIATLPEDTAVFYFSYIIDAQGEYLPHIPIAERLLRRCQQPVFTMNSIYMDLGVVGGILTEPFAHGEAAALMAVDFLRGIPLDMLSAHDYENSTLFRAKFNKEQLVEHKIDENILPSNAQIIEKVDLYKERHRRETIYFLIAIFVLLIIMVYLIYMDRINRKLQKKMQLAQRQWEDLLENLPAVVFRLDDKGRYIYLSSKLNEYLGIRRENILNKTAEEAMLPDTIVKMNREVLSSMQKAESRHNYEFSFSYQINNSKRFFQCHFVPDQANRNQSEVHGIVFDITSQHEHLIAIRNKEEQYADFFTTLGAGFLVLEAVGKGTEIDDFKVIRLNPAVEELLSMDKELLLTETVSTLAPDLEKVWLNGFKNAIYERQEQVITDYCATFERWFTVYINQIAEKEIAVLFYDVTSFFADKLKLEKTLQNLKGENEKLQELLEAQARNKAQEEVYLMEEAKLISLGSGFSLLSSQFQKQLENLSLKIQDLEDSSEFREISEKERMKRMQVILKLAEQITGFIKELNRYCILPQDDSEQFDAISTINEICEIFKPQLKAAEIELQNKVKGSFIVSGSRQDYYLAVQNILLNRIKTLSFIDEAAIIEFTSDVNKKELQLIIRDNGNKDSQPGSSQMLPKDSFCLARILIELKLRGELIVENEKGKNQIRIKLRNV